ncbi:MAG: rRNA maturation RNase YbeY [Treponema sp.]|nr:rRNA maturation RNase YbeY [Treponema sp.]
MNTVFFHAQDVPLPLWTKTAENFIKKVLKTLGRANWEVSVLFCGNKYIKSLNRQYRNKDEATDVLSFPQGETAARTGRYLAGDIVVSLNALEENVRFFNVSADEELRRLLVHGILHLCGEDHATNKPEEPMLKRQEEILARLAGEQCTGE